MADANGWHFEIANTGKTDLDRLDAATRRRVLEKLVWFADNFQNSTPLPLGGRWRGFFKLRIGDWRVVYGVNNNTRRITVYAIDNRNKIYKRRV